MLNVFNQNTDNLSFNSGFLSSLLLGAGLSDNSNQNTANAKELSETKSKSDIATGDLEIIYAEDGDSNYDNSMDSNGDSRISYKEYLRYCEQNSKTEEKRSDTKISEDKRKFATYSFGHAYNAYNKAGAGIPKGKIFSEA